MAPVLTAVTDHVHLARTPLVNWTLVTGDSGVLLIDAGFPGQRDDVLWSLRELGFGPDDLTAILLTHAHVDHLGTAIWFAKTHDTPVYCHPGEVAHAKREYLQQLSPASLMAHVWRPSVLRWSAQVVANGGLVRAGIPNARPLTPELARQLPGRPMAIPTPGHTSGHCSYLVDGVLVAGDALVTDHPLLRRPGPQLLPSLANHSEADCIASLGVLGATGADTLIPGHGDLWVGPVDQAAQQAALH